MRKYLLALGVVAVSAAAFPVAAQPQPGGAAGRPNYSPYLNLVRGGNPTLNYFGLVRPEQQLRQQANQIQQQVTANAMAIQAGTSGNVEDTLPITGRGASFNNTSHYFNNFPIGGGSSGGSATNRTTGLSNIRAQIGQSPQASGGSGSRGSSGRR